jgi:hypothetical protein
MSRAAWMTAALGWMGDFEARGEDADRAMLLATAYMPLGVYAATIDHLLDFEPMPHRPLPPSDLTRLADEVLKQPSAAALPCNLSDEWLTMIARDLAGAFGEVEHDTSIEQLMAAPLALVIHILVGQGRGAGQAMPHEEVMASLNDYRIEVALELVNRKTGAKSNPATLATIFKSRDVIADIT